MKMSARVLLGLVVMAPGVGLALAGEQGIEAKTAFDRIKTLKGEWVGTKSDGQHGHEGKVEYKVTAAGTAVMEVQFCGTGHEMITMYHLVGDDLLVTHYCALGNQPRMKLDLKNSKPDDLSFVFDGGTNFDPAKDMHIHALRIKFLDGGKVESEWEGYADGKSSGITKIPLQRP